MSGSGYEERARQVGPEILDVLSPAIERLEWDRDTLAEYRRAGLRETLGFAVDRSRWHAKRLAGIDPASIDPDELCAIPTMTKRDLMANWDDIVTDPRLDLASARCHLDDVDASGPGFLHDEYHVLTTGGSTGEPAVFCWSTEEVVRWVASVIRWTAAAGLGPTRRTAWVAARSLRHPSAALGLLNGVFATGVYEARLSVPIDQPLDAIVEQLNELQPDSMWVVCSMLPALVGAARSGALTIEVDRISVGGDALDPKVALAASEMFGAPVLEGYPTTDVGHIAHQAVGESGLYINDDFLLVETVDADDRPVALGEDADHVLVTSLHHRTLPMIRYRIDDRIRLDPTPGRYAAFQRIAAIDGRSDDLFTYGSTTVHPHVFRSELSRFAGVCDYEVTQTAGGAVIAVVVTEEIDVAALEGALCAALRGAGLPAPSVTVDVTPELRRTAVGKRRRFVPQSSL
jgi:phenylacetate-CoA ligase